MIAFKNVDDLLKMSLRWEHKLKDLYDVAEVALRNPEAKQVITMLQAKIVEKLKILENVRTADHGETAWIRYLGDYDEKDLIAMDEIKRTSGPGEIFQHLSTYEAKLQALYARVAEQLTSQGQKELFESLALFKSEQVDELKRLMKIHAADH